MIPLTTVFGIDLIKIALTSICVQLRRILAFLRLLINEERSDPKGPKSHYRINSRELETHISSFCEGMDQWVLNIAKYGTYFSKLNWKENRGIVHEIWQQSSHLHKTFICQSSSFYALPNGSHTTGEFLVRFTDSLFKGSFQAYLGNI